MALVTAPLTKYKPYPFLPIQPPKSALSPSSVIQNFDHNPERFPLKMSFRRESLNLFSVTNKSSRNAAMGINDSPSSEAETEPKEQNYRKILFSDVEVKRERNLLWGRKWNSIDIGSAGSILALHLLSLFGPFYFNWPAFWVAFGLHVIAGFGITLSYHRNLTHRSFKLPKWLEYLFACCGVQALQGTPIDWVRTHRYHHQFVESERDPHSPTEGFWYSHICWIFDSETTTEKYGEGTNVGDLEKQPFYKFIQKTYLLHPLALGILLYAIGGLPFLVWGMGVRIVWVFHITWLVNSACHIWGNQAWNTGDLSRNNWFVAILSSGEGWHNNHHAFEYSARHGLEWWQIDTTWYLVRFLQALGLATDVKLPNESQKQRMSLKD